MMFMLIVKSRGPLLCHMLIFVNVGRILLHIDVCMDYESLEMEEKRSGMSCVVTPLSIDVYDIDLIG